MVELTPGKPEHQDPSKRNPWRKPGIPPIMWILLLAVIIGSSLFAIPRIIRVYEESGLAQTVSDYRETKQRTEMTAGYETAALALVTRSSGNGASGFSTVLVPIELPADYGLDDILIRLLEGPGWDELSKGLISLIPAATRYYGSRITRGIAYIDISADLLVQPILDEVGVRLALEQIVRTARTIETVEHVGILIDHAFVGFDDDPEALIQEALTLVQKRDVP